MTGITAEQLEQYLQLDEQRKALDRQSRQLADAQAKMEDRFLAELNEEGKREVRRGDYRVFIEDQRLHVAWKEEFIALKGPEAAAALAKLAPTRQRVRIAKVA
jgi:mRNA-degrading endonuclease RelE of RelBE toxin-antitoxin system